MLWLCCLPPWSDPEVSSTCNLCLTYHVGHPAATALRLTSATTTRLLPRGNCNLCPPPFYLATLQ
eukprot:40600-Chlamydomonas_euryale.AAC.1